MFARPAAIAAKLRDCAHVSSLRRYRQANFSPDGAANEREQDNAEEGEARGSRVSRGNERR